MALAMGLFMSGTATAEDTAAEPESTADSGVIEEVIVTANRREQNVQDVSGSINVLGGGALEAAGVAKPWRTTSSRSPALTSSTLDLKCHYHPPSVEDTGTSCSPSVGFGPFVHAHLALDSSAKVQYYLWGMGSASLLSFAQGDGRFRRGGRQ